MHSGWEKKISLISLIFCLLLAIVLPITVNHLLTCIFFPAVLMFFLHIKYISSTGAQEFCESCVCLKNKPSLETKFIDIIQ